MTPRRHDIQRNDTRRHYDVGHSSAEQYDRYSDVCHSAKCHSFVILSCEFHTSNCILLSITMLSSILMSGILLCVILQYDILLNTICFMA
jgi:hypothetical protein